MARQSFWRRVLDTLERTYERRIRAASLVHEYGEGHASAHTDDDSGEAAVISNVPRGTRLGRRPPADTQP